MNSSSSLFRKICLTYGGPLPAIPIFYWSIFLSTAQPFLAVVGAGVGVAIATIFVWALARRGQISARLLIFVLPLLVAFGCAVLIQLSPLFKRQRAIQSLRAAGITVQARQPDRLGEWAQDRLGTVIPVWLADSIGDDCLSVVSAIQGDLGAIQSTSYQQLDLSRAHSIHINQESRDHHLTDDFIDWLNRYPNLDEIALEFDDFSIGDGAALGRLRGDPSLSIVIRNVDSSSNLRSLQQCDWLHVVGESLAVSDAQHLAKVAKISSLKLEIRSMSLESIATFRSYPGYLSLASPMTSEQLIECANLGLHAIEFYNLSQTPSIDATLLQSVPITRDLRIRDSQLSVSECKDMAALFRCEVLSLIQITKPKSDHLQTEPWTKASLPSRFLEISTEQLESFWELPNLEQVRVWPDDLQVFVREDVPESGIP